MPKSSPLVFIDTNVWFSAFYGSENAGKLLTAHINGKIRAVVSQRILEELNKNIRLKIPRALPPLKRFLEATPPVVVRNAAKISRNVKEYINIKDRIIFQSALDTKIPFFVTGNLKDFKVSEINKLEKTKVISPKEAVVEILH